MRSLTTCLAVALFWIGGPPAHAQAPELVKDIFPGAVGSHPAGVTLLEKGVVFATIPPSQESELWRTDGTTAGTFSLGVSSTGLGHGKHELANNGRVVLFWGRDPYPGPQLWRSDGTIAGTFQIGDDIASDEVLWVPELELFFYFAHVDEDAQTVELWATDGSRSGTRGVAKLEGVLGHDPRMATWRGRLAFWICDTEAACSLWSSDGTSQGTRLLISGFERPSYCGPLVETASGRHSFFHAVREGDSGLWRTDGTPEGTELVDSLTVDEWFPFRMRADAERLFFFRRGEELDELRVATTDGPVSSVVWLPARKNFQPSIFRVGPSLFVIAADRENAELLVTDGTAEGTAPFEGCPAPCRILHMLPENPSFFAVRNELEGYDAWSTDGTPEGTYRIGRVCHEQCQNSVPPGAVHRWRSGWLFAAAEIAHSTDLWWSPGRGEEIVRLTDFDPGAIFGQFRVVLWREQLLFSALTPDEGTEVWRLDVSGLGRLFADGFESGDAGAWDQ